LGLPLGHLSLGLGHLPLCLLQRLTCLRAALRRRFLPAGGLSRSCLVCSLGSAIQGLSGLLTGLACLLSRLLCRWCWLHLLGQAIEFLCQITGLAFQFLLPGRLLSARTIRVAGRLSQTTVQLLLLARQLPGGLQRVGGFGVGIATRCLRQLTG